MKIFLKNFFVLFLISALLPDGKCSAITKLPVQVSPIEQETKLNQKKEDCTKQHGDFELGKCWCGAKVLSDGEDCNNIKQDKENDKIQKETDKNQRKTDKAQKESQCENEQNGKFKRGKCWCGAKVLSDGEDCNNIKQDKENDKIQKESSNENPAQDEQFLSDVDKIIDAYKEKVKELTKKSK